MSQIEELQRIEKQVNQLQREQSRLETEYNNAVKETEMIQKELKEKGYPTDLASLRNMYADLKAEINQEIINIQQELDNLHKPQEEKADDFLDSLPF